jgi:hypothetical protein
MTQTTECPDGGCGRYPNCPCGITPSETLPESQTTDRLAEFSLAMPGGWNVFQRVFPDTIHRAYDALPQNADRIGFLRTALNDDRISGHVMIWTWVKRDAM